MEKSVKEQFGDFRGFYSTRATQDIGFRLDALRRLYDTIKANEADIAAALAHDLRKSPEESYLTETGIVLGEIRHQMKRLRRWARDKKVASPVALQPSKSRVIYEPKGVVLVIAPWNYPFQLAMDPAVGAIAAGNCVAIKPSTTSSATCAVIKKIIAEVFDEDHVAVFDGDHAQTAELLSCRFDHIFFTGGASFGRTVMREAAGNLIPVTLELGGKSPCIVDRDADIEIAARRIVWGKLINAGQTCIAPDYLFVHSGVKEELIAEMKRAITRFYGEDVRKSPIYPRIISDKAFDRLTGYLSDGSGTIIHGGAHDKADRYIEPTLLGGVTDESPVMREEIFGPILPVMEFSEIGTVIDYVNSREKPLAFYYFGRKREGRKVLSATTSGGACINDVLMHVVNPSLPFGGAGMSGMGRYHGKYSFETFSNARATVISRTRIDVTLRYPLYKGFGILKKLL